MSQLAGGESRAVGPERLNWLLRKCQECMWLWEPEDVSVAQRMVRWSADLWVKNVLYMCAPERFCKFESWYKDAQLAVLHRAATVLMRKVFHFQSSTTQMATHGGFISFKHLRDGKKTKKTIQLKTVCAFSVVTSATHEPADTTVEEGRVRRKKLGKWVSLINNFLWVLMTNSST